MTTAVGFSGFGFTYAGAATPSLRGVTLDLPAGRLVSVIAPQGAGKTTLLRAAAGLFETMDERGTLSGPTPVRLEGEMVGAFFDGYVQVTLAVETVREEIALPLYASKGFPDARASRVEAVARELKIEHLLDREVTALSGGEEKLVGIAAALVVDSYLYVLDEPFEQLDIAHYAAVIRAMKRRVRAGALVVAATGSVDTALNIADSLVIFDGTDWRFIERPTYADVASIPGLTSSSLGRLVIRHGASLAGVRRFRDGVLSSRATSSSGATVSPLVPATDLHAVDRLLDIRDVSFGYGAAPPVLSHASLAVDSHTVCGILGPNGAGKSTLARLAAGVLQPRTGVVTVAGHDLRATEGPARARVVRVSFQTPEHELFRPTLGDELDWEGRLLGVDPAVMRSRVAEMLDACAARVRLDEHPYDLDPWQRKLFACLSALAIPRRLVILDEPTLRLGQEVRSRLGGAITRYAADGGAVVFVTHDHEFAASICHSIAVVKRGKIEAAGEATAVLADAAGHAATNIYSFPSYFLDRAVRRRPKLPPINSEELGA